MPSNVVYTKVFLIPKIEKPKMKDLPFSYEYMAQVFANALRRDDHETLDNSDIPKVFNIIWLFLGFSKHIRFNKQYLEENELDTFLELPIINE